VPIRGEHALPPISADWCADPLVVIAAHNTLFCEHGLTYAYYFSRHSYSAIRRDGQDRRGDLA